MSNFDTVSFYPVQGKESAILNSNYAEGHVYFATDTKRIFLDANGVKKMPMGGNSGVYYGQMILDETPDENQTEFSFTPIQLEINQNSESITIPNINDLILNIPDGCFYRVSEIEKIGQDIKIITTKLTLAGGSGGNSGPSALAGIKFDRITPFAVDTLAGQPCPLEFKVTATDASGERTGKGTYKLLVDGVEKSKGIVLNNDPNDPYDINRIDDISTYLNAGDTNTVKVIVSMDTGGSANTTASKSWDITSTTLRVEWPLEFNEVYAIEDEFELSWNIFGGSDFEKITTFVIDDNYQITHSTFSSGPQKKTISPSELGFTHGVHKIELSLNVQVGQDLFAPTIVKYIMFKEDGNNNYIINYNFDTTQSLTQYGTVEIPISIYGLNNNGDATISIKENGLDKTILGPIKNGEIINFPYIPMQSGIQTLTFICDTTEVILNLDVKSLGISLDELESSDFTFKFKASDFVDNNSIKNWESNGIKAIFSNNFDWINGGLQREKDEMKNLRSYVCVKAGSSITFDYELFKTTTAKELGKCFKIIFKVANCKSFDAQFLNCYDDNSDKGLIMTAQNAYFKSQTSSLDLTYCEDSYIEFELDIGNVIKNKDYGYIRPWIDGVPAGVKVYSSSADDFTITNETKLVIGSEDCDVYIYLIKMYEKTLTDEEHLNNFIADAPTSTEILNRYIRNDILDDKGEISPKKLAKNNPNCRVHIYTMPRMTKNKDDKVICNYEQYHGDGDQVVLSANNVEVKVQGTSSAAYGLAAFNLDSKFVEGFSDANGNHFDEWSMTENSIPVNYFCTKVNVASAEGANNALNQEWYNRFQPYQTLVRCKNIKARDTMEFTPGVLFIQDENKEVNDTEYGGHGDNVFKDTPGYVEVPYPKMYSVCNMGNSKKNIKVFHDSLNVNECCIENNDNQLAGQRMIDLQGGYLDSSDTFVAVSLPPITDITLFDENRDFSLIWDQKIQCPDGIERSFKSLWFIAMSEIYSFRYPDLDEIDETMAKNWLRFVNWMVINNPSEKYAKITFKDEQEFLNYSQPLYTIDEDGYHQLVDTFEFDKEYYYETEHKYGATNEPLSDSNIKVFAKKTFNGYKASEEWQKNYIPVIKDCEISTYEGTYTNDTFEYRMAKMLSECEDYMCIDSIIYHYLFIERHSMVDNVAKNTFWSTEDGKVWNLTKDYDNDTADGNNNQGKLALSYGQEPGDTDSAGVSIFNAGSSTWLTFIRNLHTACRWMYRKLEEKYGNSLWGSTEYLEAFNNWQSTIPERCWIEDYYRKYIRPYEIYKTDMFLEMHEGGKKTHQRKQFETYQNLYISSKYFGSTCSSNFFTLRPNAQNIENLTIPFTLYSDCYVSAAIGSGVDGINYRNRFRRGESLNIQTEVFKNLGDSTAYIYPANLFESLGSSDKGLNDLLLKQLSLTGNANRLRLLALGTFGDGENTELTTLDVSGCKNLEELYVAEMKGLNTVLNLNSNMNIKQVDARNSSFSGVTIADGAPIKTLQLNNPNTLILSKLSQLETLSFQNFNDLTKININDIDKSKINSKKDILDLTDNSLTQAKLLNINWILQESNEINNQTIVALQKLLDMNPPFESEERRNTVSGLITITESCYNSDESINLYNKYINQSCYPYLDIDFQGKKAKLPKITIYNGNGKICWSRRVKSGTLIKDALDDGPNGAFDLTLIFKQSSESHTYTFEGIWDVYKNNSAISQEFKGDLFESTDAITQDIIFKPRFQEIDRFYSVTFYTYNPSTGKIDLELHRIPEVKYGTKFKDIVPTNLMPVKPEASNAPLKQANVFKGYGISQYALVPVADDYKIKTNMSFYAIFETVNDITTIVYEEWFDFVEDYVYTRDQDLNNIFADLDISVFPEGKPLENVIGCKIVPKKALSGKVTIPSKYNNKPVICLGGDAKYWENVTHIFCQNDSSLYEISAQTFYKKINGVDVQSKLAYFDFTQNTVRYIGSNAFRKCPLNPSLVKLSNNLYYVDEYAFNGAFNGNVSSYEIPGNISLVKYRGLSNLKLGNGCKLIIGSEYNGSKVYIGDQYYEGFTQNDNITEIDFYSYRYTDLMDFVDINDNGNIEQHQLISSFKRPEITSCTVSIISPKEKEE